MWCPERRSIRCHSWDDGLPPVAAGCSAAGSAPGGAALAGFESCRWPASCLCPGYHWFPARKSWFYLLLKSRALSGRHYRFKNFVSVDGGNKWMKADWTVEGKGMAGVATILCPASKWVSKECQFQPQILMCPTRPATISVSKAYFSAGQDSSPASSSRPINQEILQRGAGAGAGAGWTWMTSRHKNENVVYKATKKKRRTGKPPSRMHSKNYKRL